MSKFFENVNKRESFTSEKNYKKTLKNIMI